MVCIKHGDHRAFSQLYDRYALRLNGFFFKMLWGDRELASDQVHELFTKIIERPELFNTDHSFQSWVFQVAANMCKNHYRKRDFELAYRKQLEKEGIELPRIQQQLDEPLQLDLVLKVLAAMEEDKRTLFLLRYQQEMSIASLADHFDVPAGTIKSRLHNIRNYILDILEKENKTVGYGKS